MLGKVIIFIFLFACWYAFSGENGSFYIVSGVISCLIGVFLAARMQLISRLGVNFKIFRYWLWLAAQVITSGVDVILRVWKLKPIDPVMEEIMTNQTTAIGHTIYGNSVTLTPGTVTVDVGDGKMVVHALSQQGLESLKTGEMDRRVKAVVGKA